MRDCIGELKAHIHDLKTREPVQNEETKDSSYQLSLFFVAAET